jgi:hypothetical protein
MFLGKCLGHVFREAFREVFREVFRDGFRGNAEEYDSYQKAQYPCEGQRR